MFDEQIKKANGARLQRLVGQSEATELQNLIELHQSNPEIHTIRVYGQQGFVARAYKYRADISLLEACRNEETGVFEIHGRSTDAKRGYGAGAHITINGRAA